MERRRREARPGTRVASEKALLMVSDKLGAGDLRDRQKHLSSCATFEEDFAAANVMDGSALPAIDALPSRNAISKTPRAAGYRGSDFVRWHETDDFRAAPFPSALGGAADLTGHPRDRANRHRLLTGPERITRCRRFAFYEFTALG